VNAESMAKRRIGLWLLVGGGGSAIAVIGGLLLIVIFTIIFVVFLAGFGHWIHGLFTGTPPPMGTNTARTLEWLQAADQADPSLPNALAMAIIAQASGGEVYGDRNYCVQGPNEQSSGLPCVQAFGKGWTDLGSAVGLTGLNVQDVTMPTATSGNSPHAVAWNLTTGLGRLSQVLATDPLLKTALPAFHRTTQAPPHWIFSNYASTIQTDLATYGGPQMAIWAIAPWNRATGVYEDPNGDKDWVLVTAGAPTGPPWTLEWKAPTVKYVQKTTHITVWEWKWEWVTYWTDHGKDRHTKKERKHVKVKKTVTSTVQEVFDHNLTGHSLEEPVAVFATLQNGTTKNLAYSGSDGNIPVWPGGSVWGGQLALDHITKVTAVWPTMQETQDWPPVQGQAVGHIHLTHLTQSVKGWWPDIQVASQQTGVSAGLIAAIMSHESGGVANAYNPNGPAYGLMQILPSTAVGLPGYNPATWTQPQENLILGAELLAANYQDTGNNSWRATIAAYYGGLGTMELLGYRPGMPWSQASIILNTVPAPQAGNNETMTGYANAMAALAQSITAKYRNAP